MGLESDYIGGLGTGGSIHGNFYHLEYITLS